MSIVITFGAYQVVCSYVEKRKNTYYFRRRVPEDVRSLYPDKKAFRFFSLKTSDPVQAAKKANELAAAQDRMWDDFRAGDITHGPDTRKAALALLEAWGAKPGEGVKLSSDAPEHDVLVELIRDVSNVHPEEALEEQDVPLHASMAAEIYYGAKVVPYLSEALTDFQKRKGEDPSSKGGKARKRIIDDFIGRYRPRISIKYGGEEEAA